MTKKNTKEELEKEIATLKGELKPLQDKLSKMKEFVDIIFKEKFEVYQDEEGNIIKVEYLLYSYVVDDEEDKHMLEDFIAVYRLLDIQGEVMEK